MPQKKSIPNPNRRFVRVADALTAGKAILEVREEVEVEVLSRGEEATGSNEEEVETTGLTQTRYGWEVKKPQRYRLAIYLYTRANTTRVASFYIVVKDRV